MKTRRIEEKDLDTLWEWYRGQGWVAERHDVIFPSTGFIVDGFAATWLYVAENANLGWLAFQVINPKKNKATAFKALHMVYERAEQEAKSLGLQVLKQTISHSSLKKLAEQHNYLRGDMELTAYWKLI